MKRFYQRLSIFHKMVLVFTMICISAISISSLTIYAYSAKRIDQTAVTFARSINSQVVSNMENFAESYQGLMLSVLVDNSVLSSLYKGEDNMASKAENVSYVNRMLFRLVKMQPNIQYAGIILNNGEIYQTGITGEKKNIQSLQEEDWIQKVLNGDESFSLVPLHTGHYENRNDRKSVISVIQRLRGSGRKTLGYVLLDVDPESIVDLGEEVMGENGIAGFRVIVENDLHQIIYDSSKTEQTGEIIDGFYIFSDPGEDYEVITESIEEYGLKVHTFYPKSSLLLRRFYLVIITILMIFIGILLSIGPAVLFSRSFTKPIFMLKRGFAQIEKEEYHPIDGDFPQDEVGELIRHFNRMVQRQAYLTDEVYRAGIQKKDAQLTALQAQINPHMLFNTLEAIRMKALIGGNKDVAQMTLLLGKMFRAALDNSDDLHTVKDEVTYVRSFLDLQNLRFKTENRLEVRIPEEILACPCITMLFQPLVENSLEHGRKENLQGLNIQILGENRNHETILSIIDDGTGIEPERLQILSERLLQIRQGQIDAEAFMNEGRVHIGLENTAKRLHLQYEGNAYLEIVESTVHGTRIDIHFRNTTIWR